VVPKSIPDVPNAAEPIGPYSVVTEANGFVFVSGQVGINPVTSVPAGDNVVDQARRVMENIKLILDDLGLGFGDVVKTTIFLADMADFPLVNDVYASYFGDAPPARTTIQAAGLPGGYLVEIETIAAR
jgi:2-iminobutanoate/2-iminopropanoate deaminase